MKNDNPFKSPDHPFHLKLVAAGHKLRLDEYGEIDIFVCDYGHHNGPGCELCGQDWCQHCGRPVEPCPAVTSKEARP